MSFLAPGFLIAAGLAALAVIGLHLLSTREARVEIFPTTRFIPDTTSTATATRLELTDLLILLLRVLLVLLLGAALARPVFTRTHRTLARVVAVDVSRAVAQPAELAREARPYLAAADVVILFDSTARVVHDGASDSLAEVSGKSLTDAPRGSLSAAVVVALREAARLSRTTDSVELIIASPFAAEETDAATLALRDLWPGRITTVQVAASAGPEQRRDSIRIVWADSLAGEHWTAMAKPDTVSGIRAGDAILIHPFVRQWRSGPVREKERVYARWADGEAAALEIPTATGCMRTIGFSLPTGGDALLRPDFQRFLSNLAQPCGEPRNLSPLGAGVLASIRGNGPLASTDQIEPRIERVTPLMPWLLLLVVLLGVIESIARARRRGPESNTARSVSITDEDSDARAASLEKTA